MPEEGESMKLAAYVLIGILSIQAALTCSGTRPDNLGVRENGKLQDCPPTPNCVTSFCDIQDQEHYIPPLSFSDQPEVAWKRLESVVRSQERVEILQKSDFYLYAEFTSRILRFVDDVEFLMEPKSKLIHVRSASRLGRSDLGVNRKRIEKIRSAFSQSK